VQLCVAWFGAGPAHLRALVAVEQYPSQVSKPLRACHVYVHLRMRDRCRQCQQWRGCCADPRDAWKEWQGEAYTARQTDQNETQEVVRVQNAHCPHHKTSLGGAQLVTRCAEHNGCPAASCDTTAAAAAGSGEAAPSTGLHFGGRAVERGRRGGAYAPLE
jgi:hypothetical protein